MLKLIGVLLILFGVLRLIGVFAFGAAGVGALFAGGLILLFVGVFIWDLYPGPHSRTGRRW